MEKMAALLLVTCCKLYMGDARRTLRVAIGILLPGLLRHGSLARCGLLGGGGLGGLCSCTIVSHELRRIVFDVENGLSRAQSDVRRGG